MIPINDNVVKVQNSPFSTPLSVFLPTETTFRILEARLVFQYVDGKRTDVCEGSRYRLADLSTGQQLVVRVPDKILIVDQAVLDNLDTPVYAKIDIDSTIVSPYEIKYGVASVTIKAPGIELIKGK